MTLSALISGLDGPGLNDWERGFLRDARPCGVILFRRNCETPDQIARLCDAVREAVGAADYPILIDQEGGRVQRLAPPHWRRYPPARLFGTAFAADPEKALAAAYASARLAARDLRRVGVNVNCAPVLDLPAPGAHDVIGDRAYASNALAVISLGRAVAQGHLDGGVLPVMKHLPGHGRAAADSHFSLPRIAASRAELSETDFMPFRALADLPAAMTAHVLLTDVDPDRPASASARVIGEIIRGEIGFGGFLVCDDIGMGALKGAMGERAAAVIAAGCDAALHCSGKRHEMEAAAAACPSLAGAALERYGAALAATMRETPFEAAEAEALLGETLAQFA